MPHLSRLLAAICAVSVILVSLPTSAGIGDKDLPPLHGEKTKLLYTVVGVSDGTNLATVFHCTSTERDNGNGIAVGIQVFTLSGVIANALPLGDGVEYMQPGETVTLSTRGNLAFPPDNIMSTGNIAQGSARIFATSKNVLCAAMIVDPLNNPPTSMVMLPVFRATKQGGM